MAGSKSKSSLDVEISQHQQKSNSGNKCLIIVGIVFLLTFLIIILALCGLIISSFNKMSANDVSYTDPKISTEPRRNVIAKTNNNHQQSYNLVKETPVVPKLAESAKVLQHPMNNTVKLGDHLIMNCEFDRPVECAWMRKSNTVEISGRYKYLNDKNENGNYVCSFSIQSFRLLDAADWQCVGIFSDHSSIVSKTVWLSHPRINDNKEATLVQSPSNVRVEEGGTATMQCEFNREVECAWMRRGENIEVRGRYAFASSAIKDEKRKNCSLIISGVKAIDVGEWACSSMADSDSVGALSLSITLSIT